MMPTALSLPGGIDQEALLAQLRPLCWGAADILRAYARGEQPPHGFAAALTVADGGSGPVTAADLAVNEWLLQGLEASFPDAPWTLLSEETAAEALQLGLPLPGEWLWLLDPLDGTKDFLLGTGAAGHTGAGGGAAARKRRALVWSVAPGQQRGRRWRLRPARCG